MEVYRSVAVNTVTNVFLQLSNVHLNDNWCFPTPLDAPWLPKEAPHAIFPFLHGETSQVCKDSPRDEQLGPDQNSFKEIQGAPRKEKGLAWFILSDTLLQL